MKFFSFTIPGEPTGKGRARVFKNHGITRAVTPEKTANYESLVKYIAQQQSDSCLIEGPVQVLIGAMYSIPNSASKKLKAKMLSGEVFPIKKPDADNVAKIICDALNGILYRDDSQITDLRVFKRYSATPCVDVTVVKIEREEKQ